MKQLRLLVQLLGQLRKRKDFRTKFSVFIIPNKQEDKKKDDPKSKLRLKHATVNDDDENEETTTSRAQAASQNDADEIDN